MKNFTRLFFLCIFLFCISGLLVNCGKTASNNKVYFGAPLELKDKVLSGAGQSEDGFDNYVAVVGEGCEPSIYMLYCALQTDPTERLQRSKAIMDKYNWPVIPQIGLSMTHDGKPEEHYEHLVAQGIYDENIDKFINVLREWNRPTFVRIGFEFNGDWNGYEPDSYRDAFRYVTNKLRAAKLDSVAIVWCYGYPHGVERYNYMLYYPGDEYVDWWGVDLFTPDELVHPQVLEFMEKSLEHKKPLIIGESTAKYVGTLGGQESWDKWFVRYFEIIRDQPNLKAFSYINWDWTTRPYWADWGDCRIEMNETVSRLYREEMKNPIYKHGGLY